MTLDEAVSDNVEGELVAEEKVIEKSCNHINNFLETLNDFDLGSLSGQSREKLMKTQEKIFKVFGNMAIREDVKENVNEDVGNTADDESEDKEAKGVKLKKSTKPRIKKEVAENPNDVSIMELIADKLDNRKVPSLRKYDEHSGESLTDYLGKFENYCQTNLKGGTEGCLDELENYLTGETIEVYKTMKDVGDSYETLKEKMLAWHADMKDSRKKKAKSQFEKACFDKSDTLYLFSTKLEKLFRRAYPHNNVEKSIILREKFAKAIPKSDKKKLLAQTFSDKMNNKPICWTSIQKFARNRDNWKEEEKSSEEESEKEEIKEIVINVNESRSKPVTNEVKVMYDPKQKRFYIDNPKELNLEPSTVQFTHNKGEFSKEYENQWGPRNFFNSDSRNNFRQNYRGNNFRQNYRGNNFRQNYGSNNFRQNFSGNNLERENSNNYEGSRPKMRFQSPPKENLLRCYSCNKLGHIASQCRNSGRVCFLCGKPGHISTNCYSRNDPSSNSYQPRMNGNEEQQKVNQLNNKPRRNNENSSLNQ